MIFFVTASICTNMKPNSRDKSTIDCYRGGEDCSACDQEKIERRETVGCGRRRASRQGHGDLDVVDGEIAGRAAGQLAFEPVVVNLAD